MSNTGLSSAERRRRYGRRCACGCGRLTDGSNGASSAPDYVRECYDRLRHEDARERVIAALQAFAREHGRPPTANEWRGRQGREARGVAAETQRVQKLFGSWNAALVAAGFPARGFGDQLWRSGDAA